MNELPSTRQFVINSVQPVKHTLRVTRHPHTGGISPPPPPPDHSARHTDAPQCSTAGTRPVCVDINFVDISRAQHSVGPTGAHPEAQPWGAACFWQVKGLGLVILFRGLPQLDPRRAWSQREWGLKNEIFMKSATWISLDQFALGCLLHVHSGPGPSTSKFLAALCLAYMQTKNVQ